MLLVLIVVFQKQRVNVDEILTGACIPAIGGSFKEYALKKDMAPIVEQTRQMLGKTSRELYDRLLRIQLEYPDCGLGLEAREIPLSAILDRFLTQNELDELVDFMEQEESYKAEYGTGSYAPMDVYHGHHGLRYLSQRVLAALVGTVFVDGGAYIGDSALVFLKHYSPARVLSFDVSRANGRAFRALMKRNGISQERCSLYLTGLGETSGKMRAEVPAEISSMARTVSKGGDSDVQVVSLDSWLKENPQTQRIGLIKFDLEGFCLEALRGSVETIRNNRPLLLLGIYHNPTEFFEVPLEVKKITDDLSYKYAFARLYTGYLQLREVFFLAIPR